MTTLRSLPPRLVKGLSDEHVQTGRSVVPLLHFRHQIVATHIAAELLGLGIVVTVQNSKVRRHTVYKKIQHR